LGAAMTPCDDLEIKRRAAAFITHIAKDNPKLWEYFLEVCGLNRWLSQYLSSSPFQQVPPIEGDVRVMVERENQDISRADASKVFHAVQAIVRDEHLVEQAFNYRDP
jgi:hypothetical protein